MLRREHGSQLLTELKADSLSRWLQSKKRAPVTWNNYRRHWVIFFQWAIRRNYANTNPAAALMVATVDETPPAVLSPEDAQRLLAAAAEHDAPLVRYLAIGLFAGVRPREIERLEWPQTGDYIEVGGKHAKTRERRLVTILDNLRAWLDAFPSTEPLYVVNHRKRLFRVQAATKPKIEWSPDIMRHSFATYHLALFQDSAKTEHEMGHRDRQMLFRHYRNLATKEEAEKYFAIAPTLVGK